MEGDSGSKRTISSAFFEEKEAGSEQKENGGSSKQEVVEEHKKLISGDIRALVIVHLMSDIIARISPRFPG